ncbi:TonB-dependent receptor [Polynucleobacter sp. AP-Titi-500A-B4]|uniref:TonB-dependent receptor n=1 Tax=Polynucleobacter sp. AP-Titi-500A-B4 TaxID=2576923 RepID=UPI001BFDD59E|nr:TonB-dependent receptor [Polynucleobacter sp. AP-Titi-500A-B4]QWE12851.1 TonB-dependent receptor [Polynucleobacter sp. AP-Titi-500A-B4]
MLEQLRFSANALTLIFLLQSSQAWSQIAPPLNYDQKLNDMVVNATRSGTQLDQMSLNTTILTKEVLESSPDQTIDQVLKNVPGVFLNDVPYYQKDPTGQSINVRGLGYGRTLVLIDGLPANDAFYGTVQWNLVPMSSIESVEFVRGGVSSLYGNYGMGGVININTKTPKNSSQEVSASIGSFATGNVAASKDLVVSDAMQMRFSADYFSSEGFQNYATISPGSPSNIKNGMGTDAVKNSNIRLQNYFKPTQDTNAFLRLGYSTMADLSNNYAIAPNLIQTADVAGGSTTNLDVNKKVQVNVYYQNTNFYKQTANNLTAAPYKPYINANYTDPYSTVGASAQYTHDLKVAGIDQYIIGIDARNISASNQTNTLSSAGAVNSVSYAQGQQNFYGLLGQIKSSASTIPLEATLGARVDAWNSQTPTSYNAGANGSNPVYQGVPNQSKTQLSPTLGLLYKANKNWDLRSAAYQAFHAPSMNNTLRSYGNSVSGYSFANPNLTPETMTGYEVGTDYRWKSGFAQLTAFNNYIQNAIASYKITSANSAYAYSLCSANGIATGTSTGCYIPAGSAYTNVSYYTNQQNLLSRGIELQYHHDVNAQWALDGGYSYTRTVLTWTATTDPTNAQVGGVPMNMANAAITYYPVPQASLTTTVRYVGNSWMATGTLPVPAYAIVGLKANYQVTPQASVFASVVNLLNRQYVTFNIASQASSYQAGMPQAVTVGARITF